MVGWYNELVDKVFHLPYHADTVALCVLSIPCMYERAFKPWIEANKNGNMLVKDPIDECVGSCYQKVQQNLPDVALDFIQDYEQHHGTRRPKLLVQTAGHVSGAAYYYKRSDVKNDPWHEKKRIYGASLHPRFGGWFAFRGAIIMKDIQTTSIPRVLPHDSLPTDNQKIDFLDKFNNNWQNNMFRDVIPVADKYSEEQQKYFETLPKNRAALLGLKQNVDQDG
ncbi:methylmalonic aciduria and homocystinuria type C protein homolog [Anneissia japonica]|uniref:methylmalonic aciduria and homocystinuria type C protein homolog n=1 Tax=Anneissia japonica TaxID=1529436 RepID=UPI001425793B|nr:methylmalonic aciduria and homocystinuria type C protein homolog [Anneissia japonica]